MKEFKKFNGTDWQTIQPKKYDLKEISGTPPFSFESDGRVLQDWSITGQTVQNGTPTPENPIEPSGCGERTENLFDLSSYYEVSSLISGIIIEKNRITYNAPRQYLAIKYKFNLGIADVYTISLGADSLNIRLELRYAKNGEYIGRTIVINPNQKTTVRGGNEYDEFYVYISNFTNTGICTASNIMLNSGSTALPYEPYGYKLPLLSGSTPVDIYLGESQTTRRIKKLVLTGKENWKKRAFGNTNYTFGHGLVKRSLMGRCSHYARYAPPQFDKIDGVYLDNTWTIIITDLRFTTETDFKSYLAAQYAAGTPVTVWYVLAEPEAAVVNEPLMKIGNYADEINLTNSGVNIPTIEGSNTLTVNTTIQPSSMSIKKGLWKRCSLYEYTPYVSGVPPFTFKSDGQNLRDWSITGQTVQDGTPTPENPIVPSECGERTNNLFSGEFSQFDNVGGTGSIYAYFYIPEDFTLTLIAKDTHTIPVNIFLGITKDGGQATGGFKWAISQRQNVAEGNIFTVESSINGYHYVSMYLKDASTLRWILDHYYVMLNSGSTALPYEPYGYKLPLLSGSTPVDIYLGESQTTRRIKKLVLTGGNDENWFVVTISTNDCIFRLDLSDYPLSGIAPISTHYTGSTSDLWHDVGNNEVTVSIRGLHSVAIHHSGLSGVTDWKAFLAAQYAAGTPVTVWYVLAEPETGIVNEPLMKIGDYADEISKTGTSMNIPTASGSNTLTVSTTVQPSEMTIESISQWIKQN